MVKAVVPNYSNLTDLQLVLALCSHYKEFQGDGMPRIKSEAGMKKRTGEILYEVFTKEICQGYFEQRKINSTDPGTRRYKRALECLGLLSEIRARFYKHQRGHKIKITPALLREFKLAYLEEMIELVEEEDLMNLAEKEQRGRN